MFKSKLCSAALCAVVAFGCVFGSACKDQDGYSVSNDVSNYAMKTLALKAGESFEFDVTETFKDSGIEISDYKILSNELYSVKGNKITAKGTGRVSVGVELTSKKAETRFYAVLGTLYAYDEADFTPVTTAQELAGMKLDGLYVLKADIDLSAIENWQPVGNFPADNTFTGMFINPDGYVVENLTVSTANEVFHGPYGGCLGGLFGNVSRSLFLGIELKNVNIDVSDFDGEPYSDAGGVAAMSSDCYFKDCKVTGSIKANGCAGGITGSNSWGVIDGCSFEGNVQTDESKSESASKQGGSIGAGGIAGYCGSPETFGTYKYSILNCTVNADISAVFNAGGIVGRVWGEKYIKDCNFTGELSGTATGKIFANSHRP